MIPDIALLQEAYDHYLINPDLDLPGSYFSFIGGFPLQEEEIIEEVLIKFQFLLDQI